MTLYTPHFRPGDEVVIKLQDGVVITTVRQCIWNGKEWLIQVEGDNTFFSEDSIQHINIRGAGLKFDI